MRTLILSCCLSFLLTTPFSGHAQNNLPDVPVPAWTHLSSQTGELPKPDVGRQVAALIQDINLDGENDFVIASYTKMAWFRYNPDDQNWTRYLIEGGMPEGSLEAGGAFYDVNGDGSPDLVMGSAWQGEGGVWWWENPAPDFNPDTPWTRHLVVQVGGQHHDQLIGDFTGEGTPQLVFWDNHSGRLYLARIPSDPTQPWKAIVIAQVPLDGGRPEGLAGEDINGDGNPDIVGGGWWFEHLTGDNFQSHPVNPERQFSRTAVGQLIQGGRPEIILGSGDGVGPLEMYQWKGGQWVSKSLIPKMDHGHTLQVADLNGDGNPDIFTAEMYDPGAGEQCRSYVLYGDGQGNFRTEILSTGIGSHESKVGDLNGDGRPDILQKDFQHEQRIDIWLNQGISNQE